MPSAVSLAVLAALTLGGAGRAHATCGSTACFLSTLTQDGALPGHAFRVDLSYRYVDQDRKREGSSSTDEVLTPGIDFANGELELDHHRELSTGYQLLQADMSYGVTDRFSLMASVPLVAAKHHEHVVIEDGEEHFSDGDGSTGFGDIALGARYGFLPSDRDLVLLSAWVKLPTGAHTREDSEGEITEPGLQPGTGSTDLTGALLFTHQLQPHRSELYVSGSYRHNGTNDLEYRFGDETLAALGASRRFWARLRVDLQVNLRHADRDEFLEAGVPSTGSTLVNLTPGLRFDAAATTSLYLFVAVPVYQHVNEAQLAPSVGVVAGISHRF
jgi:hypothetical protein